MKKRMPVILMIALLMAFAGFFVVAGIRYAREKSACDRQGFYACMPGNNIQLDTIEVTDSDVHITGSLHASEVFAKIEAYAKLGDISYESFDEVAPAFVGYTFIEDNHILYIGLCGSPFLGKLGNGNTFDLTIPATDIAEVHFAYSTDTAQQHLVATAIWKSETSIALNDHEKYGLLIQGDTDTGTDFQKLVTVPSEEIAYFFSDLSYVRMLESWSEDEFYPATFLTKNVEDAQKRLFFLHKTKGLIRVGNDIGLYQVNPKKMKAWTELVNNFEVSLDLVSYTPYYKILNNATSAGNPNSGSLYLALPDPFTGRDYMAIGVPSNSALVYLMNLASEITTEREKEVPLAFYKRVESKTVEFIFRDSRYICWSDELDRITTDCYLKGGTPLTEEPSLAVSTSVNTAM